MTSLRTRSNGDALNCSSPCRPSRATVTSNPIDRKIPSSFLAWVRLSSTASTRILLLPSGMTIPLLGFTGHVTTSGRPSTGGRGAGPAGLVGGGSGKLVRGPTRMPAPQTGGFDLSSTYGDYRSDPGRG